MQVKEVMLYDNIMKRKCWDCNETKPLNDFHRDKSKKYGFDRQCKVCKNKYASEYRKKNKDKTNAYQREYYKNRKSNDRLWIFKRNLRTRTCMAFNNKYWTKKSGNIDMLGTDYKTAFKYIESQFTEGMNWDNHGEWHIDHIIPLSSAKTKEEMEKLCHYTNLQPLWKKENLSKGDKIL
jgi:hypothetical protein